MVERERDTAGAAEGRPYHHGNLASAMVEAGLRMAAAGGPDAVVLRKVARRVGVSPTAAYRHFDGQAGLTEAVKAASLTRLAEHLRSAMAPSANGSRSHGGSGGPARAAGKVPLPGLEPGSRQERAIRRLEAVGRAYFDFAITQPGLFRCFCIGMPVPGADEATATDEVVGTGEVAGTGDTSPANALDPQGDSSHATMATEPAFGVLVQVLDELVDAGVISGDRRAAQIDIALWSAVHGLSVLCLDGPLAQIPREQQYEMLTAVTDVIFHGIAGPTTHTL